MRPCCVRSYSGPNCDRGLSCLLCSLFIMSRQQYTQTALPNIRFGIFSATNGNLLRFSTFVQYGIAASKRPGSHRAAVLRFRCFSQTESDRLRRPESPDTAESESAPSPQSDHYSPSFGTEKYDHAANISSQVRLVKGFTPSAIHHELQVSIMRERVNAQGQPLRH
jgi:hypothetical protein